MYHRYTTQTLCDAIYIAVASQDELLSRHEICEKIGRHKSPHIVSMIEYLVEKEYFCRIKIINNRGNDEYRYGLGVRAPDEAGACQSVGA